MIFASRCRIRLSQHQINEANISIMMGIIPRRILSGSIENRAEYISRYRLYFTVALTPLMPRRA